MKEGLSPKGLALAGTLGEHARALLEHGLPVLGRNSAAPSDVSLEIGRPLGTREAALGGFILLLLLKGKLAVRVAIVGSGGSSREGREAESSDES